MTNVAEKLLSLDEFLDWERQQPERYELANGIITMMTGGSAAHVTIGMNIGFGLRHALRDSGCRPFGSDMKVIANGNLRYPDITVVCRPVGDREDRIVDPTVVIEVLSPTTERVDRGIKKSDYFATPSIRQYAIVEQDERRVDLYTRTEAGWINEIITGDMTLDLSSVGVTLTLDAVYEDTELDITRPRAGGESGPAG